MTDSRTLRNLPKRQCLKESRRKPELEELGHKERLSVLFIPEPNTDQSLEFH